MKKSTLVLVVIIVSCLCSCTPKQSTPNNVPNANYSSNDLGNSSSSDGDVDITPNIKTSNYEVQITNTNSFDYENAELELNGDYVLKGINIKAGETFRTYWREFSDSDGNRYNPQTMKHKKFTIYCDLSNGKKGYYYGEKD